ncbi:MAG TPA: hypothetical protein VH089_10935 [Streptosporangiaceae bacterium]|nr:hypothetical protein [Streptosporangiaceae bacterium]
MVGQPGNGETAELEAERRAGQNAGQHGQPAAAGVPFAYLVRLKHVGHVLGKLGAANRTEAVARARARDLGLIP